jgi:two-component system phosphate regulon response regulator PhoB
LAALLFGAGLSHRILVVDDEADITALVAYHLAKAGYRVSTAANGQEALRAAREERPDIVVLDLMLPGIPGYEVLAELRRRNETSDVGVILLTARRDEPDRIQGLTLGADDYLTKPFSPAELVLRVQALLRRLTAPAVAGGSTLVAGPLLIDRAAHRVIVDGRELGLTATEYKLLVTLVERRGRVQARSQLLETVLDAQPDIQTRTIDMHVQRLRTKLGDHGDLVETVRGFGYRFAAGDRSGKTK